MRSTLLVEVNLMPTGEAGCGAVAIEAEAVPPPRRRRRKVTPTFSA